VTRATLTIAGIGAIFVIACFVAVLVVHSIILLGRLLLIALLACVVISISRVFGARRGVPK